MLWGQERYVLRRERSGGILFDRPTGKIERISEGHYILLERAHNLGTGASGIRRFVSESFADERNAEAFLSDCVRRGILEEEKGSSLQIITPPLPVERLPLECNSAPNRLYWCITGEAIFGEGSGRREVSLAKARDLLRTVAEAGTLEIWIFGGEPTRHPFFLGLVNAAKENGLFVTVETHARFDEQTRNKMLDSLVDRFALIIAGSAATHDALFGEGAYQKMVGFMSRLAQRGEKLITLVMPLGKSNIDKLNDAVGMAKAVRGEELLVIPAKGDERVEFDMFAASVKESAGLAEGLGVAINTPCDLVQSGNWDISGCPAGVSEAFLDYDGNLRACRWCDADSEPIGDISSLGYLTLWLDSSRFEPYRTKPPTCIGRNKLFGNSAG
jgi:MoaA/NifB/PqqE/SkfB family radical SAM enzyme